MRLLALAGDIHALIAQIRLVVPLTALCGQNGWSLALKSFHECARADLAAADVLVVQRAATARVLRLQQHQRRRGGAVVYEIDDLLTEVAPHISGQAASQARVALLQRCLAEADAVCVSTARLAHELGLSDAVVVPNYALQLSDRQLPVPDPAQPVHLLFASSERLDTGFIYPALRDLPGVRIVVVGPPAADFASAQIAVQAVPLMPREQFVTFARRLPNVLAVIPLEDSRFAACKSAVKWFDYAAAGVPSLCSAVSPYIDVIEQDVTGGLVDNNSQAWRQALCAAVSTPLWRQRVAAAASLRVEKQHSLQHSIDAWQSVVAAAVHSRNATRPAPLGLHWRLREATTAALEGAVLRLRSLNRRRLARRSAR